MDQEIHDGNAQKSTDRTSQVTRSTATSRLTRLLQFDLRFLMFVMAVVGVGILWWKDRRELELRIAAIELRYKPFVGIGWSADQATGPPNTLVRGDQQTAWASATPDGQDEWLELSYEKTVTPYAVHIYETYNPGALTKVSAFDKAGNEVIVWQGTDPTSPTSASGVSIVPLKNAFATNRIRLYLNSKNVAGWNEIDAVGLRYGIFGNTIWASRTSASSEFGWGVGQLNSNRGFQLVPSIKSTDW